ncbi:MAG: phosphoenolpyruvate--protein phosphotransferase [Desulfovibrio sp.]|jgi:phosphotransferase system enzyme I (PtsI)|nr:phosphoenolpyruvate--protein phosphotransferase [Desulfovibrio sp.]
MARAVLAGTPVSPGIAIGTLHFLHDTRRVRRQRIHPREVAREQEALCRASVALCHAFEQTLDNVPQELAEYRDVIGAQMELARDPKLLAAIRDYIAERHVRAELAIDRIVEDRCAKFRKMEDPYLRDRAQDIRAVGLRLRECLKGSDAGRNPDVGSVLAAEDVSPADFMDRRPGSLRAVVTVEGGPTSHSAILARSLRIPTLVGVAELTDAACEGEPVIVDALEGRLLLDPDEMDLARYVERQEAYQQWEVHCWTGVRLPAETTGGRVVAVEANLENPRDLPAFGECGAEGIGLYRTEFAYFRERLPSEEELYLEYSKVAAAISPAQVVFRTLDSGADKLIRAQAALREQNPALGLRGIRFSLRYPDIFRGQLRALLRAGATGNVALLLPMITGIDEMRQVRALLMELQDELEAEGVPYAADVPLGGMIETPAAVLICDALAGECDFFSIGTNDLVHYLLSIDRTNRHVGYLNDPMHPAVVRALKQIMDTARDRGVRVTVCGELASDPYALTLLTGLGVDAVSAAPRFIPAIKHLIRQLDASSCDDLAECVLKSADAGASRRMVHDRLARQLGDELPFFTASFRTPGQ